MKTILYWSAYVLIILGIIIWSLLSMFGCSVDVIEKPEVEEYVEHIDLDSLSHMADSAINDVHHTINDLDNDVKTRDNKIKSQLAELKRAEENAELKKQEALVEIEKVRLEKALVDSAIRELEDEFEQKWDDYERELLLLEKDIDIIVQQLNTAVEEIAVVVLQLGQKQMLYDQSTEICELVGHLPPGRLDSLIANTPILRKRKLK